MRFHLNWSRISTDGEPFLVVCDARIPKLQELAYTPHVIVKLMHLSDALTMVLDECEKRHMDRVPGFRQTCECVSWYLNVWAVLAQSLFMDRLKVKPSGLYDSVVVRKVSLRRALIPILIRVIRAKAHWWIDSNTLDQSWELLMTANELVELVGNEISYNAPPRIIDTAEVLKQLCLVGKYMYDTVHTYLVIEPQ